MYSIAEDGLYVDMYGGNVLNTTLKDGTPVQLEQQTDYPWSGNISLLLKKVPAKETAIFLRIPGWCKTATLSVNGEPVKGELVSGTYTKLKRQWKAGDRISLILEMPATLIEANPLVEENRNQVAVKRGPLVYCIESANLKQGQNLADIIVPAAASLYPVAMKIDNSNVIALEGEVKLLQHNNWKNTLYRELNTTSVPVRIKWIPYYSWANRGRSDMSVWLPVSR